MATYFSNNMPAIQATDNLQTLYLMNPGFVGYPDAPAQGNILMFGQHVGNQLPGNEQQFITIPMMSQPPAMGSHPGELSSGITSACNLRQHSLWRDHIPSEFSFVQSFNQTSPTNTSSSGNQHHIPGVPTDSSHQSVGEVPSQVVLRREQQGGLSLSLSSSPVQLMASTNSFRSDAPTATVLPSLAVGSGGEGTGEERTVKWEGGLQSVLMGSKYLKAAQQLLDEVVNVGKGMKSQEDAKSTAKEGKAKKESTAEDTGDVGINQGNDFSAAERQELQMKKAKLITMLDEVEQRYKQYRHQMLVVVSSFEAAAGAGAARAYTALALQTISKQFRCLRDAISGQIRLSNGSLGEEDGSGGGGKADGSRLRYIDHQLRQQRALQQLGMVQNNAWRPQRGLPERSVSVLRAWLFEHFLHPYPKDADKVMLAKQTGLTRSQVSNWFINARVRLWKPMVEEMYKEEVKEKENEGRSEEKPSESAEANEDSAAMKTAVTGSPHSATQAINKNTNNQNEEATEKRTSPPSLSTATTAMSSLGNLKSLTGFGLIMSPSSSDHAPSIIDNDSLSQFTPKKMRNNGFHNLNPVPTVNTNTNITGEAPNAGGFGNRQGYDLAAAVAAAAAAASENGGSYGSYQIGDIGRYRHESFAPRGNGVSLTLGLPHCDSLSLSGSQHACLSSPRMVMGRRNDLGSEASNGFCSQNPSAAAAAAGHPDNAYDSITMHARKRFAAQLLPDFVS